MPTLIENIEFSSEFRGYSTAAADVTSTLKANAGEKIRANIQIRVQIESIANAANGGTFTVATISGSTKSITSNQLDFISQGWRVGDVFDFNDVGGATLYTGGVILQVQGGYIEYDDTASAIPDAAYSDAEIKLTTELDTLRFNYNFTPASNNQDLIQQLLQSVQGFEYNGLTDLAYHPGTAFAPIRGNTGSSQAKRRIATANYIQYFEIEHDFIPIPAGVESQLVNLETLSAPDPYRNETIFYNTAIELGVGSDGNTLRPLDLTRLVNDSVGWFNENFNGGVNNYALESISYLDVTENESIDQVEAQTTTRVTAVISTTGTFVTAKPIAIYHSYLPEAGAYQTSTENYQDTWLYESLVSTIDAGATSGTIINDFTAVLAAGEITLTFDLVYSAAQLDKIFDNGAYMLSVGLEDDSLTAENSDRVNLLLDANRLTKSSDDSTLIQNPTMEFYDHPEDFTKDVTTGFTSLEVWNEEGVLLDGRYEISTGPELIEVVQLDVEVIAENTVTGNVFVVSSNSLNVNTNGKFRPQDGNKVQVLDYSLVRPFQLQDTDQFKLLQFGTDLYINPVQTYSYQIGLKIAWQDWLPLIEADQVFYDDTEPNNNLNKKTSNYSDLNDYVIKVRSRIHAKKEGVVTIFNVLSPEFKVFDYELDRNPTPQYTGSIALEDENGQAISANIMKDEDTTCITTFDDGTTKTAPADFEAVTRLQIKGQGTENSIHEISTLRGVITGDVLKPVTGDNMSKSIVAGNYTATCLIDGTKLNGREYTISTELFDLISSIPNTYSTEFDGVIQYGNMPFDANIQLDILKPLTISFYFKTTATVTGGIFDSRQSDAWKGGSIVVNSAGGVGVLIAEAFNVALNAGTTTSFNDGNWHHCIFVYDGGTDANNFIFNVDGVDQPINVGLNNATASHGKSEFYSVGRRGIFGFQYDGTMDEATFWDKALSPAEISELYNGGSVLDPTTHSANANLKTWLRFGDGDTLPTVTDNVGSNNVTLINGPIFVADAP